MHGYSLHYTPATGAIKIYYVITNTELMVSVFSVKLSLVGRIFEALKTQYTCRDNCCVVAVMIGTNAPWTRQFF